jgi:REP element-mobilizing transposase RayT
MGNQVELFVHVVWATLRRRPWIDTAAEAGIERCLRAKAAEHRCEVLAIGIVSDHVHVLLRLAPAAAIARLVADLKGSTSHWMTHELRPNLPFRWQAGYGAFTVSTAERAAVRAYVADQKARHARDAMVEAEEPTEAAPDRGGASS